MKKIVLAFLFIFLSAFFCPSIRAQEKLFLAVTQYETREQKDALFDYSTRVLGYFEGEEVENSILLSLITDTQRSNLAQYGLTPKILDYETDLSYYVLLSVHHPDQPIPLEELKKLGEIFVLPKYHILLKLPTGNPFLPTGEVAKLVRIPFPEKYVKPDILAPSITPIVLSPSIRKPDILPFRLALVALLLLVVLLVTTYRKKQVNNNNRKSLSVIFLVLLGLIFILGLLFLKERTSDSNKYDLELKSLEEF